MTGRRPDPARYLHTDMRGHRPPRRSYTMTGDQFRALGGLEDVPSQYDPGAARRYSLGRNDSTAGSVSKVVNETDPNGWVPPTTDALQALADAHNVHLLTIHWPDKYSPDFTARPRETP